MVREGAASTACSVILGQIVGGPAMNTGWECNPLEALIATQVLGEWPGQVRPCYTESHPTSQALETVTPAAMRCAAVTPPAGPDPVRARGAISAPSGLQAHPRQTRSKIAAMPWPPPMHIVTSA
jgi:hypothetical protein